MRAILTGTILLIVLMTISDSTIAQTTKKPKAPPTTIQQTVDNTLSKLLAKMNYWANDYVKNYDQRDSIVAARDRIAAYVTYVNTHYTPAQINELPKCAGKGLRYVRADDKKVNFFSWKERTEDWGRPVYHRQAFAGIVTDSGLISYDLLLYTDGDWFYKDLFSIKVSETKSIYVATFFAEYRQMADAFEISDQMLKHVPFFVTDKEPDFRQKANFAFADYEHTDKWPVMTMNSTRTKLYVPNGNPDVTKRYWEYQLEGSKMLLNKATK
jgi:hypothetical protein